MKKVILIGGLMLTTFVSKSQYLLGVSKENVMEIENVYRFVELPGKMDNGATVIMGNFNASGSCKITYGFLNNSYVSMISYSKVEGAIKEIELLDANGIKIDKNMWVLKTNTIDIVVYFNISDGRYNFTHMIKK